jgi:hypothetical protein
MAFQQNLISGYRSLVSIRHNPFRDIWKAIQVSSSIQFITSTDFHLRKVFLLIDKKLE